MEPTATRTTRNRPIRLRLPCGDTWCIVLAAGDGVRLGALTTFDGERIPKQFCSLDGEVSLLELALRRARRLVPGRRIVAIVAAGHRRWWRRAFADLPPENLVVQPSNRGTAAGVLLPLARILARDPGAVIVLLPSDHHIVDEWTMTTAILAALAAVVADRERIYLLGVEPERPDSDLGWIVPVQAPSRLLPAPVARFREKPPAAEVGQLIAGGAVANTLILAARGAALLGVFEAALPELIDRFRRGDAGTAEAAALAALYADLPVEDFSRRVLELGSERLSVIRVPPCGWNDLGTPEGLVARFADARPAIPWVHPPPGAPAPDPTPAAS